MRSYGKIVQVIIICIFVFLLFGCGNRDFELLKSEYDDLVIQVVSSLDQNDVYNSASALQKSGKLEDMKELLVRMSKEMSISKKDEYDESKHTYESISEITSKALNWDKLSKGDKSELQLKITIEKSLLEVNKQ